MKIAFLCKKFYDDDGAAEGECDRQIQRGSGRKAKRHGNPQSHYRRKENLADAGGNGDPADGAHLTHGNLNAHEKQKKHDAELAHAGNDGFKLRKSLMEPEQYKEKTGRDVA